MKTRLITLALVIAAAVSLAAHPPVSVVIDRQGNAYYSDLDQVWKVAPDGTKTVAVAHVHTHELYLDAQGNLFGENLWYNGDATKTWGHYVWRRSPDGAVVKVIPDREGFLTNYSFVRDGAGNMYLANRDEKRVERLAPNGTKSVVATGFANIRWMNATADGTLYVVDTTDVVRIAPSGAVVRTSHVGKPSLLRFHVSQQHNVMGLWTDRAGNVYAAVYGEGKVKRIGRDGTVTVIAESPGTWGPTGGAFAPNGDLLLLEWSMTNQARLRRLVAAKR